MLSATRRTLFGAALALSAAPSLTASAASAVDLHRQYLAALARFRNDPDPLHEDPNHERVMGLLYATLDAPIHTPADAAVKIRLASESFESGELTTGKDVAALEQVARWLEASR